MNSVPFCFIEEVLFHLDCCPTIAKLEGPFGEFGRIISEERHEYCVQGSTGIARNCATNNEMEQSIPKFCFRINFRLCEDFRCNSQVMNAVKLRHSSVKHFELNVWNSSLNDDVIALFTSVKVTHLEVHVNFDDTIMKLVKTLVANGSLKNVSIWKSLQEDRYITAILPVLSQPQREKVFFYKCNTRTAYLALDFLDTMKPSDDSRSNYSPDGKGLYLDLLKTSGLLVGRLLSPPSEISLNPRRRPSDDFFYDTTVPGFVGPLDSEDEISVCIDRDRRNREYFQKRIDREWKEDEEFGAKLRAREAFRKKHPISMWRLMQLYRSRSKRNYNVRENQFVGRDSNGGGDIPA
ncbi:hypothetical protein QR680_016610 [Steinernema hermaphroditum]|uniref:Uncharacterized protein n=1 Tax=Steinernema hermaphroditum TaxID=289476 RepID=A0AA39HDQ0_9BILA|nr:hypothetical protein QR680_016610 [Steinernema hermaphroditum]